MARGKVELRRIDDKARRLVSFSKRRSGLLKKARELAVLCDGQVGVIVFSPKGKLSHFPTHSSLEKTIERYKKFLDAERSITDHVLETEGQHEGFATDKTNHEILEVDQRFFGGGNIEQMNVNTLTKLEEELGSALNHIRSRKMAVLMDLVKRLREQEKALVCQNQRLQSVVGIDGVQEEEESLANEGTSSSGSRSSTSSSEAMLPPPATHTLELFVDT